MSPLDTLNTVENARTPHLTRRENDAVRNVRRF